MQGEECGVKGWRAKSEIRNSKSETNPKSKPGKLQSKGEGLSGHCSDLSFEVVSDFEIRISDFTLNSTPASLPVEVFVHYNACSVTRTPAARSNPLKRLVGVMVIGTALLSGCGENNPPGTVCARCKNFPPIPPIRTARAAKPGQTNGMDDVVATVSGEPITMRQLVDPLIESHGLTMLVNLVELELAKQNAAKAKYHIVVTDEGFCRRTRSGPLKRCSRRIGRRQVARCGAR